MTLTHGSLFTGIGGIDLGFERAGIETIWQVEIDDYARRVLEKHWPGVERHADIRECGAGNLARPDIISGGFPCQDLSVAGKQQGLDAGRSGLWWEMLRVACELRPRILVVENVPNLLAGDGGEWARTFFGSLAESGFDAEWGIVSAADCGAPHLRKRVFVIAYAQHVSARQSIEGGGFPAAVSDGDGGGRRLADSMADGHSGRQQVGSQFNCEPEERSADGCASWGHIDGRHHEIPDAESAGMEGGWEGLFAARCQEWWSVEPDVGRVAHGVPARVDRLRCLGNAVVPQVAEWIGRRIVTSLEGKANDIET